MGAQAAEYIIDHLASPKPRPLQLKIECPLIERDSVAPVVAGGED
jgi:DNA-binding LacI/PurR family transcriptional regulator